jgi:hypothetical protein
MADSYMLMPRGYGIGADQYRQNGQEADKDTQQSQLFKALLQQSMQQQSGGSALGTAGHLLSQYMMMNALGGSQQPYSTDPTSANFMGPPAALAG